MKKEPDESEGMVDQPSEVRDEAIPGRGDEWIMAGDVLTRVHHAPRVKLFTFDEVPCPIPLEYIDVMRTTDTDLTEAAEARIEDHWYPNQSSLQAETPCANCQVPGKGVRDFIFFSPYRRQE